MNNNSISIISILKNLFIYIISILFLFICILNNPYRFSGDYILGKLTYNKFIFIYSFLMILCSIFLIYFELFGILNLNNIYSIFLPIILILIPSLSGLLLLYNDTKVYEKDNNDNDLIVKEHLKHNSNEYSSLPSYMFQHKVRLTFHIIYLILLVFIFYQFKSYIDNTGYISTSELQYIFTNNNKSNISRNIIYSVISFMIILQIIIIYYINTFKPCKIGLSVNWDL